jgi:hypothetical protein
MSRKPISRPQIDGARQRLERWRREHGGTGRAIPEELWDEAARVAQAEGIAETARALRLDRYRLARRAEVEAETDVEVEADASTGAGFVELSASRLCLSAPARTVVRLEGRDGERVTVEFDDEPRVDVVALSKAFWSRGR